MQTDDSNIAGQTSFAAEIEFEVSGDIRFLSHAEIVRTFLRAFGRAKIPVSHSQGFNPRPKISLPFPRPVGVESEEELLVTKIIGESADSDSIVGKLADQMPQGVCIKGIKVCSEGTARVAQEVTYIFGLCQNVDTLALSRKVDEVMGSQELPVERDKTGRSGIGVDVRKFIEGIDLEAGKLVVKCKVTDAGTVRVDELMEILGIQQEMLARPVKRQNIVYRRA